MKRYRIHWINILGEECQHSRTFDDFQVVSRIVAGVQKVNPAYKYRIEEEVNA
jgi:hypothetical protein